MPKSRHRRKKKQYLPVMDPILLLVERMTSSGFTGRDNRSAFQSPIGARGATRARDRLIRTLKAKAQ